MIFVAWEDQFIDLVFHVCCAAEDWLNPSQVLEAFEARAARMSVSCAQNLTKFSNPEEGTEFQF